MNSEINSERQGQKIGFSNGAFSEITFSQAAQIRFLSSHSQAEWVCPSKADKSCRPGGVKGICITLDNPWLQPG